MLKLKELRKEKGISLKELGSIVGVAESTMSLYENGKRQPDYETLLRLAEYFDVTVDYLLRGTTAQELDNVYFSFAKQAQSEGIDPEDIKMAIEMINKLKKKD